MRDLLFLLILFAAAGALSGLVWLRKSAWTWCLGAGALVFGSGVLALMLAGSVSFTFIRLLCHLLFIGLPLYLLLSPWRLSVGWRRISLAKGVALALIGGYAFFVEPRWLEVSLHTIHSPLIKAPLRVVVLADIQTDKVGDYERQAFLKARALQADLVLLPGDYVQEGDQLKRARVSADFNALMKSLGYQPRLGAFAVEGDMENGMWPELFAGSVITPLTRTQVLDLGPLELAGLDLRDSRVGAVLPPKRKYRIVVGHAPDFALRPPSGDLFLAGHTHGGQIKLPFIGPLLTLSLVPRAWAGGGLVDLPGGQKLIVSRGVGHERGPAPRLRFLCRPEIVVVDLLPD